jgi:hypothetical protein
VNTTVNPVKARAMTTATATTDLTRGPPFKDKITEKAENVG